MMGRKQYINLFLILWSCSQLCSCAHDPAPLINDKKGKEYGVPIYEMLHLGETPSTYLLKDTNIIKIQIREGENLWKDNKDSAKQLLLEAAKASYRLKYYKGIINAIRLIASDYSLDNNKDSALFYNSLIIYAAEKLPAEYAIKELVNANVATQYYKEGQFDSAFYFIYKALNAIKEYEFRENTGRRHAYQVYNVAAAMWLNLGNPETALPYSHKAQQLAIQLQDSEKIAEVLLLSATIHFRNRNFDTALILYLSLLQDKATKPATLVQVYNNLANLYIKKRPCHADSALHFAREGVRLSQQLYRQGKPEQLMSQYILACAYVHKGEHDYDSTNFLKAEAIFEKLEQANKSSIISGGELVNLYVNLATFKAINHRQFEKAYYYSKQALKIRDSLYNKEQLQQRATMDTRYRVAQKDKDLAQQQLQLVAAEKKVSDKNVLLLSIISAASICIMLLSWGYFYLRQKSRKFQNSQALELLKARINGEEQERERIAYDLHDSVNSRLAATQSYLVALQQEHPFLQYQQDFNRIAQNLLDTSEEVRQIAHNLAPKDLMDKNLPQVIKEFCGDILTPRGIKFEVQVIGDLNKLPIDFCLTLYRIVQELIHNIIKHAEATHVLIILSKEEGSFSMLMEDNGNGLDWPSSSNKRKGIGIKGMYNRIKSLNGTLHREAREGKGTTIHITTPCQGC